VIVLPLLFSCASEVTVPVDLPPVGDAIPVHVHVVVPIRPGDRLPDLLADEGLSERDVQSAVNSFSKLLRPEKVRAGAELRLEILESDQSLLGLDYTADDLLSYEIWRDPNGQFSAGLNGRRYDTRPEAHRFVVHHSIWESLKVAGLDRSLASGVSQALAHSIDVAREIQDGDVLTFVVERRSLDKQDRGWGRILAVRREHAEQSLTVYRYDLADREAWYLRDGSSTGLPFLRTPFPGREAADAEWVVPTPGDALPSVVFEAPEGTPVSSVGSGTVTTAGMEGDAGNTVRILHEGGFGSAYGHLGDIAPGIKPGATVRKGQMVGRVGHTGVATGSQARFTFFKVEGTRWVPVEFASSVATTTETLTGDARADFEKTARDMDASLASAKTAP